MFSSNITPSPRSFPSANDETLLRKFNSQHRNNAFYAAPQMRDNAFFVTHYAGRVKYQIADFREKNLDMMRHDVMVVLKNSSLAFVRELVGRSRSQSILLLVISYRYCMCCCCRLRSGRHAALVHRARLLPLAVRLRRRGSSLPTARAQWYVVFGGFRHTETC